eukprot:Gregarina_sp_Pseudo_9__1075@NODE_16_length_6292_cov_28_020310_g14_i0_p1_GENE_NODE_16_length_6292_cov_28_020310_g14_i0NODE_16_length_6292_cov_28_020310_g14_i0_p1_ORF_typecomplete_len879_score239_33H_PPase/PF03030_16/3_6e253tRNAsynt_2_TM/PF16995_5/0_055tRNAsynt_2_TM/PF16995_5/51tRNAsynt_2_TM/PF16995_5/8_2e03tRNAsynt_2_TM/PF16995_5/4_1e03tRNAsynt_2_TM/PF16995_5/4_6e03DUF373/PF04123_13/0_14DUF373/PF04123_13/3e02WTF/PF03303_13/1_4e03WTF/PF03303_13/0_55_NODE_16_length_6292_cov_28_020310_g14_i022434879
MESRVGSSSSFNAYAGPAFVVPSSQVPTIGQTLNSNFNSPPKGFSVILGNEQRGRPNQQFPDIAYHDKDKRGRGWVLNDVLEWAVCEFIKLSPGSRWSALAVVGVGFLMMVGVVWSLTKELFIFFNFLTMSIACVFILFSFWLLTWIFSFDEGDAHSMLIAQAIRDGAEGFYSTQNSAILKIAGVIAALLFLSYALRSSESLPQEIRESISPLTFGLLSSGTFLIGAFCSAAAGSSGVWVSVRTNSRVASAAHRNYQDALKLCFRGGAFSSIINVAMAVGGLSFLLLFCHILFPSIPLLKLPILLVGFGFGASLVAMFAQLGGGIYTKAADVGADLVGKVEAGIPEDDYRNPAVIADLVGDNVGDCAGQCADLFESLGAEMLAAMILGSSLAQEAKMSPSVAAGFVLFPLAVHSMDLVISTITLMFVGGISRRPRHTILPVATAGSTNSTVNGAGDPLKEMVRIYLVTCLLGAGSFTWLCWLLLKTEEAPNAWIHFAFCGISGIACALIFLFATQYYTDYNYAKVQRIARASESGPATNIIAGLSVGMESTLIPVLAIGVAICFSYHEGMASGIVKDAPTLGGLFGTAVATMGMLCTAVYVLTMSSFGPIADNAGGIVEMTALNHGDPVVREITDRLDAVGNVTKANTKGFSVGTAALASFLLFSAFLDEVTIFIKQPFNIVDITSPDVFVGGLCGAMVIFLFSSLALNAVGVTAAQVVEEVRRQFRERPNIMTYQELPDYRTCVKIVSAASVKQMLLPGLIAVLSPVAVGVTFKVLGAYRGSPLLGVEALGAFMMFATSTGILMALFLNNGGGAWDNAKKFIETGKLGGKGSDAHKAAVVGDTVGDPCKDTAGPSVHVLIKLIATVTLVMTPLFVSR